MQEFCFVGKNITVGRLDWPSESSACNLIRAQQCKTSDSVNEDLGWTQVNSWRQNERRSWARPLWWTFLQHKRKWHKVWVWIIWNVGFVGITKNNIQDHHSNCHNFGKYSAGQCHFEVKQVSGTTFSQVHCVSRFCGSLDRRHHPFYDSDCEGAYLAPRTFTVSGFKNHGNFAGFWYAESFNHLIGKVFTSLQKVSLAVSTYHFLGVSLDRMFAIKSPLAYR